MPPAQRADFIVSKPHSYNVGYNTIELAANKYIALAVQFENVGETTPIAVKDLVSVASPSGSGSIGATADQIWRWNTAGNDWDKYFYRSGRGVAAADVGWTKVGGTTLTTDTISAGETCFFFRGGSTSTAITLSGAVKAFTGSSSYTVSSSSYVFMAYPWPIAFAISSMTGAYSSGTPSGAGSIGATADQIWRWNTAGNDWDKYYYRSGRGVTNPGWYKEGEAEITTDVIPSGEGFFFFRGGSSAATITFTYSTANAD